MRLTCPNCDAQYEVPDEVVPATGRDGMLALALADAALKSVAEGRVVQMSEVLG